MSEPSIGVDVAPGSRTPVADVDAMTTLPAPGDVDAAAVALAQQLGAHLVAARGTESRRAFAARVGMHPNTLRELEVGEGNPTLRKVAEIASLYGVRLHLEAVR